MGRIAAVAAVAAFVLYQAHAWLLLVLVAVGYPAAYLVSLRPVPWWTCRTCGGSDQRRPWPWSMIFPGAYARGCRSKWCQGGNKVRLGVRLLMPTRAKELISG
jgi:hypothetical protein